MDRRDFFKILSATSTGAIAGSCGHGSGKLIPLLVPEHEIVPGEEQWHPAVCSECSAGCATLVRIMEGVRTIERNGEQFRERIASIKKIEGTAPFPFCTAVAPVMRESLDAPLIWSFTRNVHAD